MEQLRFLAYHLCRWQTDAMHVDSQATQAPNVQTSPRSQINNGLST